MTMTEVKSDYEALGLVLDTDKGLVVLTGCAHAGLINILTYARQIVHPGAQVYAALGGFHLFAAKADTLSYRGQAQRVRGRSNHGCALHRPGTGLLFP
jgi:metal-dependent hydrolase (beta-lactamase superfamily II)